MRTIKFRVFDKISKQIYMWSQIASISLVDFEKEHYELMQSTGLKDKNGKDIYEGDIVNDEELGRGIVIFQSGCFFMMHDADTNMEFLGLKIDRFGRLQEKRIVEVIGNIHENPTILS